MARELFLCFFLRAENLLEKNNLGFFFFSEKKRSFMRRDSPGKNNLGFFSFFSKKNVFFHTRGKFPAEKIAFFCILFCEKIFLSPVKKNFSFSWREFSLFVLQLHFGSAQNSRSDTAVWAEKKEKKKKEKEKEEEQAIMADNYNDDPKNFTTPDRRPSGGQPGTPVRGSNPNNHPPTPYPGRRIINWQHAVNWNHPVYARLQYPHREKKEQNEKMKGEDEKEQEQEQEQEQEEEKEQQHPSVLNRLGPRPSVHDDLSPLSPANDDPSPRPRPSAFHRWSPRPSAFNRLELTSSQQVVPQWHPLPRAPTVRRLDYSKQLRQSMEEQLRQSTKEQPRQSMEEQGDLDSDFECQELADYFPDEKVAGAPESEHSDCQQQAKRPRDDDVGDDKNNDDNMDDQ